MPMQQMPVATAMAMPMQPAATATATAMPVGLSRTVALHRRSSASYQIH
jgi:hypothetical protein